MLYRVNFRRVPPIKKADGELDYNRNWLVIYVLCNNIEYAMKEATSKAAQMDSAWVLNAIENHLNEDEILLIEPGA